MAIGVQVEESDWWREKELDEERERPVFH